MASDAPTRITVVDDNPDIVEMVRLGLEKSGYAVRAFTSSARGWDALQADPPDLALIDLMMPEIDGHTLCTRMRADKRFDRTRIVVLSAKIYDADRAAVLAAGADAYVVKPVRLAHLREVLQSVLVDQVTVRYWGVRGTLPRPGQDAVRYGGNTSCISLQTAKGAMVVLDAGTGIRTLGIHLATTMPRPMQVLLCLTHPHWDHINALPFFAPLFIQGTGVTICGPPQPGWSVRDLVNAQMDGRFFPITSREFSAEITYVDLNEGNHVQLGRRFETSLLMHPGVCLGYKFHHDGRTICYVTDNELYPTDHPYHTAERVAKLVEFLRGTDLLITDTTYTEAEYPSKVGWGHCDTRQVAELAARAEVKRLCLHHHDPSQDDDAIDRKLSRVQDLLEQMGSKVEAFAPAEGDETLV